MSKNSAVVAFAIYQKNKIFLLRIIMSISMFNPIIFIFISCSVAIGHIIILSLFSYIDCISARSDRILS